MIWWFCLIPNQPLNRKTDDWNHANKLIWKSISQSIVNQPVNRQSFGQSSINQWISQPAYAHQAVSWAITSEWSHYTIREIPITHRTVRSHFCLRGTITIRRMIKYWVIELRIIPIINNATWTSIDYLRETHHGERYQIRTYLVAYILNLRFLRCTEFSCRLFVPALFYHCLEKK